MQATKTFEVDDYRPGDEREYRRKSGERVSRWDVLDHIQADCKKLLDLMESGDGFRVTIQVLPKDETVSNPIGFGK